MAVVPWTKSSEMLDRRVAGMAPGAPDRAGQWAVGGRRVGPGENCTHACMPLKASRESLSLAEAINSVDAVPKKGGKYERPGTVGGTRPVPSIWYL